MRTVRLVVPALVVLSACGGNWSNRDLDFVSALPERASLKSKIPTSRAQSSPLEGVATRRDGLAMVGAASQAYAQAKKGSTDFNGILDALLNVVDVVHKLPPTARTDTGRRWGPYADNKNPGTQFQLTINQVDDQTFAWKIESRPNGGDFIVLVDGGFKASGSVKEGQGALTVHVKDIKGKLALDEGFQAFDEIRIGYITDSYPHRVEMVFDLSPGGASKLSQVGYTYREQADKSGQIVFQLAQPSSVESSLVQLTSVWSPNGAGSSTGEILEGTYKNAKSNECWDSDFKVVWAKEDWAGGGEVGHQSDCVAVSGF